MRKLIAFFTTKTLQHSMSGDSANAKPRSFKEYIAQSLIARDHLLCKQSAEIQQLTAEVMELREIFNEYFCKYCKDIVYMIREYKKCEKCKCNICYRCDYLHGITFVTSTGYRCTGCAPWEN
jgi:hypothetical protein